MENINKIKERCNSIKQNKRRSVYTIERPKLIANWTKIGRRFDQYMGHNC